MELKIKSLTLWIKNYKKIRIMKFKIEKLKLRIENYRETKSKI